MRATAAITIAFAVWMLALAGLAALILWDVLRPLTAL
jgi:hypothetical protein